MSSKIVLEMNTKAVSYLAQGEHECSHFTLQKALEGFRNVLNQQPSEEAPMMLDVDEDEIDGTVLHTIPIHAAQHKTVAPDHSFVTVYRHAFVLTSDQEPLFTENEHTVPSVLLYNMGLSHHIQAIATGQSAIFRKAMQLYTMSFTMLENASDILNDMDIMVLLALSNNMSVISGSEFYDRPSAESSRLMMERILSSTDCLESLEDEDIEFFSLNLMFLSEYQKHALAAAA
ncbi:expressed unknown protein [Seminavis robusta]|uniref:Uncharacterized protein n=1 Tax=Seminavis robusta TaxID=568900 RepID=A0A9N8E171_9STRA|nr:expressed unknown protein [Seminavis robusta]|eukprot:Sro445_g144500.1 n/a (231) ;mRNA; f:29648-30340